MQLIQQQEARNNNNNKTGTSLNLKWAETKPSATRVRSLAEIQAEEQERLMKVAFFFTTLKNMLCFVIVLF